MQLLRHQRIEVEVEPPTSASLTLSSLHPFPVPNVPTIGSRGQNGWLAMRVPPRLVR